MCKPSKQACGRCGKDPTGGFVTVNGVRYCHGDFDPDPTCYMFTQRVSCVSHDDEMRLLTTVMPDDGPVVREIKRILDWRSRDSGVQAD